LDFLKYKFPIVVKSSTAHYPSSICLLKTKREKHGRRRRTCNKEAEDPLTGLSHFHYRNGIELADEPVDPALE